MYRQRFVFIGIASQTKRTIVKHIEKCTVRFLIYGIFNYMGFLIHGPPGPPPGPPGAPRGPLSGWFKEI